MLEGVAGTAERRTEREISAATRETYVIYIQGVIRHRFGAASAVGITRARAGIAIINDRQRDDR